MEAFQVTVIGEKWYGLGALGVSSKLHAGHPQLKLLEGSVRVCDSGGHSLPPTASVNERSWVGPALH